MKNCIARTKSVEAWAGGAGDRASNSFDSKYQAFLTAFRMPHTAQTAAATHMPPAASAAAGGPPVEPQAALCAVLSAMGGPDGCRARKPSSMWDDMWDRLASESPKLHCRGLVPVMGNEPA